jgi:hypothetical protein
MAAVCKTVGSAYVGPNPTLDTTPDTTPENPASMATPTAIRASAPLSLHPSMLPGMDQAIGERDQAGGLGRTRTQVVCRLHAVLCELVPGGVRKAITAGQAA